MTIICCLALASCSKTAQNSESIVNLSSVSETADNAADLSEMIHVATSWNQECLYKVISRPAGIDSSDENGPMYGNIVRYDMENKTIDYLCSNSDCLHNSDSCPSFIAYASDISVFLNDERNQLIIISYGYSDERQTSEAMIGNISVCSLDGTDRKTVYALPKNQSFCSDDYVFLDKENVYITVNESGNTEKSFVKINLDSPVVETICSMPEDARVKLVCGNTFFYFIPDEEDYQEMTADWDGETEVKLYTYNSETDSFDLVFSKEGCADYVVGSTLRHISWDRENSRVTFTDYDFSTQEEHEFVAEGISTETRLFYRDAWDLSSISVKYAVKDGDDIVFKKKLVNFDSGEVTDFTLERSNLPRDGAEAFVTLEVAGDENGGYSDYLCICGYEMRTAEYYDMNGNKVESKDYYPVYAMISKENYLAQNPEYEYLEDLTTQAVG